VAIDERRLTRCIGGTRRLASTSLRGTDAGSVAHVAEISPASAGARRIAGVKPETYRPACEIARDGSQGLGTFADRRRVRPMRGLHMPRHETVNVL
jgi:hypothetical protein